MDEPKGESDNSVVKNRRPNRKRKKTVLQNARKYARKGVFGRGYHVEDDTYQYFISVLELLKTGFDTKDEEDIFVRNVLEQTVNEEVNYSCNQVGCRVIEALLPKADDATLERYFEAFKSDLRPLLSDRFASHVIQKLLYIAAFKGVTYRSDHDEADPETKNYEKICYAFAIKISNFLLNNLEDFVWDTCANHIMRTAVECLSGLFIPDVPPKPGQAEVSQFHNVTDLPDDYKLVVIDYAERLLKWPQFDTLAYNEKTSGLLQTLLPAAGRLNRKLLKTLLITMLERCFLGEKNLNDETSENVSSVEDTWPQVFDSQPAIRLLEVAIENSTKKMYTQIYAKCFVGRLVVLSQSSSCKFTIKKLIDACKVETEFEAIYDELAPEMEKLILASSTIVVALAKATLRFGTRQGQFIQQYMNALHCNTPTEKQILIVPLSIKLMQLEKFEASDVSNYFVNIHGSVLVQTMLEFKKPIKIVQSIVAMPQEELVKLFCDAKGCHIVDAFMTSSTVGEKSRDKLIALLKGTYQQLIGNKYGSRCFDNLWNMAKLSARMGIMREIAEKQGLWANTETGRFIARKLRIDLFKRNPDQWKQEYNHSENVSKILAEFLPKP